MLDCISCFSFWLIIKKRINTPYTTIKLKYTGFLCDSFKLYSNLKTTFQVSHKYDNLHYFIGGGYGYRN